MSEHLNILVTGNTGTLLTVLEPDRSASNGGGFCLAVPGGAHLLCRLLQSVLNRSINVFPVYPSGRPSVPLEGSAVAVELGRRGNRDFAQLCVKRTIKDNASIRPLDVLPQDIRPDLLVICQTEPGSESWHGRLKDLGKKASVLLSCYPQDMGAIFPPDHPKGGEGRVLTITTAEALRAAGCAINPLSWEGAIVDLSRNWYAPSNILNKIASLGKLVIVLGPYAAVVCETANVGNRSDVRPVTFTFVGYLNQAYSENEYTLTAACYAGLHAAGIVANTVAHWVGENPLGLESLVAGLKSGIAYSNAINICNLSHVDERSIISDFGSGNDIQTKLWSEVIAPSVTQIDKADFARIDIPNATDSPLPRDWSLLKQTCIDVRINQDRVDLNCSAFRQVVDNLKTSSGRYDAGHLARALKFPVARFGKWIGVERDEIEGYQSLKQRIVSYVRDHRILRPLCVAAFGPPGAGKSFGIKQLAISLAQDSLGIDPEVLEYNLAEFVQTEGLVHALHRSRDRALGGKVPLILFDEFDSMFEGRPLGWLKYLLAPMWDGRFRHGELQYNTGRAVFAFVGGTRRTFEEFTSQLRNRDFIDAKGPDFVSRLSGQINVRGVNKVDEFDRLYFVRRAVFLAEKARHTPIDERVLRAMLAIPTYRHGSRSLESLIRMCVPERGCITRSSLPPESQLDMHVDAATFFSLLEL